ncbi:MAG TPA: heavy metal-binding domain-containing protein [Blastococcus sp.]
MSEWDGRGLPPAAAARMARFRADGVRTSLLDVPDMAAVSGVGLPPVGEVMGCMVEHIGWQGFGGCGLYGPGAGWAASWGTTVTSGQGARFAGYKPYVDALYRGYDTALARMLTEAQAMGADGVVGVRLSVNHLGQDNREFVALGTAVRAAGDVHAPRPFVTDLPGADVAKLLHAGWMPVSIAFGISVAVRHDDYATQFQARAWGANTEVSGYTDLVQHVRDDARDRFRQHAGRAGADGAIVSSMDLRIWEIEPAERHRDHVAEATVFGTTIARFHRGRTAPTRVLTVLPLRRV